ncbi:UNVERIFIED_CONTAM: hypothetical protein O8I53_07930 [Campylobacter lari]
MNPNQIPDYKGLAGDTSDNLKGVTGIGDKKAISLLNQFNNLENLYANINQIKGKTKEQLLTDKELAFFCKELAILNKNVQMDTDINNYLLNIDIQGTYDIFQFYGLNLATDSFIRYLEDR